MQTQTETITAKFVNPVKSGGKFASIKDQTDNIWFAEPDVIADVQKGQTITVEYAVQKWSKGPVQVISRVLDGAPRAGGTQAPQPTPEKPQAPSYRSKTQEESCEIFINGFLQYCFQGTGQVPPAPMMAHMIYTLRCAWLSAMTKPISVVKVGEPVIPVPQGGQHTTRRLPNDIPPQPEGWEAPFPP